MHQLSQYDELESCNMYRALEPLEARFGTPAVQAKEPGQEGAKGCSA